MWIRNGPYAFYLISSPFSRRRLAAALMYIDLTAMFFTFFDPLQSKIISRSELRYETDNARRVVDDTCGRQYVAGRYVDDIRRSFGPEQRNTVHVSVFFVMWNHSHSRAGVLSDVAALLT